MTELTQKPGESLEHFVRRVVRKWQRQGGIKIRGDPIMTTYRWRMEIEVEAEDGTEAGSVRLPTSTKEVKVWTGEPR